MRSTSRGQLPPLSLPCLRYIFVAADGRLLDWDEEAELWKVNERWHLSNAWHVADHRESELGLVELHDNVAETIIGRVS